MMEFVSPVSGVWNKLRLAWYGEKQLFKIKISILKRECIVVGDKGKGDFSRSHLCTPGFSIC